MGDLPAGPGRQAGRPGNPSRSAPRPGELSANLDDPGAIRIFVQFLPVKFPK